MQSARFHLHADIEERHWWFTARRRILRTLVKQLLPVAADPTEPKPTTVIDIGCGTGANLASLAEDYRCVGIDTSVDAIELAKRRFPAIEFIQGFAPGDLGTKIREARLVMMNDVLEHVRDDFSLFSSIAAELEPGALMLITVPAEQRLWSRHDESFGHFRRYDAARLAKLWDDLPLKPRLLSHFNSRLYPLIKTVRTVNRLRGEVTGDAGTDFKIPASPLNRLLENVFAGESRRLGTTLAGHANGYRRGVSLIAVLERLPGAITPRLKPATMAADFFDPELALTSAV